MRIHSQLTLPRFTAGFKAGSPTGWQAQPMQSTAAPGDEQRPRSPLFSVQPGDIFAPSRRVVAPTCQTPMELASNPRFSGAGHLRVRQSDQEQARALIKRASSPNKALIALASGKIGGNQSNLRPNPGNSSQSNARTLQALIKLGANINHQSRDGISPLLAAVRNDNLQTASLLLASGADINRQHHFKQNRSLSRMGAPTLMLPEQRQTFPLLESCSLPMMALLLAHGADVNAIGLNEKTGRRFSAFDRLGLTADKKIKLLISARPSEKPSSVALHNTMAQVRDTYSNPWITGSQVYKLEEIKLLLMAGAIPTEREQVKLQNLLTFSIRNKPQDDLDMPYLQRRWQGSLQQLLDIQDIIRENKKQASLNAARISERIVNSSAQRKLTPKDYLQILKECENLKQELQKGADPTYPITQLAIMRRNNHAAFGTMLTTEEPNAAQSITASTESVHQSAVNRWRLPAMGANGSTSTFRVPSLKRTVSMVSPNPEHAAFSDRLPKRR